MVFTTGSEVVLQIVFRQFLSYYLIQGQAVWSGLDADGLQIPEKVIDAISIQPGQAFELSVWVYSDQIIVGLTILVLHLVTFSPCLLLLLFSTLAETDTGFGEFRPFI